eukprot:4116299-Prymnesium_polylepis.1
MCIRDRRNAHGPRTQGCSIQQASAQTGLRGARQKRQASTPQEMQEEFTDSPPKMHAFKRFASCRRWGRSPARQTSWAACPGRALREAAEIICEVVGRGSLSRDARESRVESGARASAAVGFGASGGGSCGGCAAHAGSRRSRARGKP